MRIKGYDIFQYLRGNRIKTLPGGKIQIAGSARLQNLKCYVYPGAELIIGENCRISNAVICVEKGRVVLGDSSIVSGRENAEVYITVNDGTVSVADHTKLACKRVWVRFGGELSIGSYTNVNDGSEIRCDQSVSIGSYNQISYNVRIWDTNTHSILSPKERRRIAEEKFPYFGYEAQRPVTAPVVIGNDCWIGENAAILKGTELGDGSVVGFGTFITNKKIPASSRVITERPRRI